jgi:predicted transposase YdaD
MPGKPFDATTKELIEKHPKDWLDLLGLPAVSVTIVDADVSTVSTDSDKIIIAEGELRYVVHLELQSTHKPDDAERFLGYNVSVHRRHRLRVRTIVILLRPEADGPCMRGPYIEQFPEEPEYIHFEFRVLRLWELPVEQILQGGVGLLPLAPLCKVSQDALPNVIRQMEQRIDVSAPDEAAALWTSTYILLGLRYPREFAAQLLKGVRAMKESSTYQAILEEGEAKGEARGRVEGEAKGRVEGEAKGRVEGERIVLLRLGAKRFGEPDAVTLACILAITSFGRLEQLTDRLLEVESWSELLA